MVEFEIHGHFASYDGWVRWIARQIENIDFARRIVDLMIDMGWLVRAGRERVGFYPYDVEEDRYFRICQRKRLCFVVRHELYGHLVYKPLGKKRAVRFKYGVYSLRRYLRLVKKKEEEQKRSDHPIAMEVYVIFNAEKKYDISSDYVRELIDKLEAEIWTEGFGFTEKDFVWGIEYSVEITSECRYEVIEAYKRWTRDGEEWQEEDITGRLQ